MSNAPKNILVIHASSRQDGSTTRALTKSLIEGLTEKVRSLSIVERDLSNGMPFIDQTWVNANFTPAEDRTAEQTAALHFSDSLIDELKAADLIIVGTPIYNFGVPAALKAWVDQITRARVTFKYTEQGPVGLLENKQGILVSASGGTEIGSENDFATRYMQHLLGFVGITDISLVAAGQLMADEKGAIQNAQNNIRQIVHQLANNQKTAA